MPTYSYKCTECGDAFDIQQAFSDASLSECPSCGGKLRKVFGAVGVTFNGSGFYRTDSRAAAGAAKPTGAAKPSGEKTSETKKDGAKTTSTSGSGASSGSAGSGASSSAKAAPAA